MPPLFVGAGWSVRPVARCFYSWEGQPNKVKQVAAGIMLRMRARDKIKDTGGHGDLLSDTLHYRINKLLSSVCCIISCQINFSPLWKAGVNIM